MTPGSEELTWYDATPNHDLRSLEGMTSKEIRNTRQEAPTVNLFQRYIDNMGCGAKWQGAGTNSNTNIIKSQQGAMLTISIGGCTEIPHLASV
jgi:di/tripeptidase